MNKVYKSVWNETTKSWVAVSELGKSKKRVRR
ncbi:ESPR-type extended signal peptide-containing protein [Vitreoscilla massiliensis]